jgi:uncharacterized membrane protein YhaH (DUF805 family)
MDWGALFFSFRGRANRAKYWLATLIFVCIGIIMLLIKYALGVGLTYAVISFVVNIAVFISGLAVATKRLHDREKSAWWLLLFYGAPAVLMLAFVVDYVETDAQPSPLAFLFLIAALVIWIWVLVEFGFLRGTNGPNAYGPDPLGVV